MTADDIQEMAILNIQEKMANGEFSALGVVEMYLARIEQMDRVGPTLNAIIEINPDARLIADELDAERQNRGPRGPLHGIPVVIKGNIDTADKMTTTAGSLALEGNIAGKDAFLVQKLREAGAIVLGKANLSEWANFRSTRSSSGWSSIGGQTRNPYALDRNPCGSSSGSAVAVAASLCAGAVGTETDGSIVCPSNANGIVGVKPTVGLVSRSGIIPISHSQDTAGPMTRTVTDAAILLGVMAGVDPEDRATQPCAENGHDDYVQFLEPDGLQEARIGVARNFFDFDPRVDEIIESCLEVMQTAGAVIVDPANVEGVEAFGETEIEVLTYEFKADLNGYLLGLGPNARVHSMADIIAFNEQNRKQVMPYFGQERMLTSQKKGSLEDEAYTKALMESRRLARQEGIDATMSMHNLDAIVAPTGGPAWLTDLVNGDNYGGGCSSPAAVAGYPHITVPAGAVFDLPVGISFFASAFQEPTLIKLAYAFEQETKARRPPQYLPCVDLGQ